jgi:hypothetical protein
MDMNPMKRLLLGCAVLAAPVVAIVLLGIGWLVLAEFGLVPYKF